ncbi:MAG: GNAT family N-acetyltransferase; N-acetyltransferase, partial [Bacteroidota bacterium]
KKGYATEAATYLSKWGFDNLQVRYLVSLINPSNIESIDVAEKIGMRYWKDFLIDSSVLSVYRLLCKSGPE